VGQRGCAADHTGAKSSCCRASADGSQRLTVKPECGGQSHQLRTSRTRAAAQPGQSWRRLTHGAWPDARVEAPCSGTSDPLTAADQSDRASPPVGWQSPVIAALSLCWRRRAGDGGCCRAWPNLRAGRFPTHEYAHGVIAGGCSPPEQQQRLYRALKRILSPAGKEFGGWGAVPGTGRGFRFEDVSLC